MSGTRKKDIAHGWTRYARGQSNLKLWMPEEMDRTKKEDKNDKKPS